MFLLNDIRPYVSSFSLCQVQCATKKTCFCYVRSSAVCLHASSGPRGPELVSFPIIECNVLVICNRLFEFKINIFFSYTSDFLIFLESWNIFFYDYLVFWIHRVDWQRRSILKFKKKLKFAFLSNCLPSVSSSFQLLTCHSSNSTHLSPFSLALSSEPHCHFVILGESYIMGNFNMWS